jgi:hypothetical protein
MITVKDINKLFHTLFVTNFLNKGWAYLDESQNWWESIPKGWFRAQKVINWNYIKDIFIPLSELQKAEEIVYNNPNQEVAFILLWKDWTQRIDKIERAYSMQSVNWWEWINTTNQTGPEIDRFKNRTNLDFQWLWHSHLVKHPDYFSSWDKNYIEQFRQMWKNNVHLLLKLKSNWRVNMQACNNIWEKVNIHY